MTTDVIIMLMMMAALVYCLFDIKYDIARLRNAIRVLEGDRDEMYSWTGFANGEKGGICWTVIKDGGCYKVRIGKIIEQEGVYSFVRFDTIHRGINNDRQEIVRVNTIDTFTSLHAAKMFCLYMNSEQNKEK